MGTVLAPTTVAPTAVPLRRNWRFQVLWIGSSVGFVGIEVADIGYPLAILALTGSPAPAGAFGFVQVLASLLVALPAGQILDRRDRRRILLAAEGSRALAAGSVAVALAAHQLTLAHLLVVAAVLGAGSAFGGPARMLMVRAVVPAEQLTAAMTQEEVRNNASVLVGPPLGGVLYGLRQAVPFLFSALAFAVSFLAALVVRVPPRPVPVASAAGAAGDSDGDDGDGDGDGGMLAGVRLLWRDPTLRAATLTVAALNAIGAPLVLITVVLLRGQGVPPWQIGAAMSGIAVGGFVGAALIGPLHRRLRPGVLLLTVTLAEVPLLALLAVPLGPWWMAGVLFAVALGLPALRVLIDVLIFRQVPDEQRGRVIAAAMTAFGIGAPLGVAVAGLLLEYASPSVAMLVLAGLLAVAAGYAATRRRLRQAPWPPVV